MLSFSDPFAEEPAMQYTGREGMEVLSTTVVIDPGNAFTDRQYCWV